MKNYFWGLVLVAVILGAVYSGYRVHDFLRSPREAAAIYFEPSVMPQPKRIELHSEKFRIEKEFLPGYSSFIGEKSIAALNRFYKNLGNKTAQNFISEPFTKEKLTRNIFYKLSALFINLLNLFF